ncbi:MAG: dTDP-4-dehydrorhamnose 3,5-epimerase [Thiothrix sp.]|uniref:dTDP-4-dehydrorhamnose 3,5-epimerase n=1 Tax=Thiothrix sp. TaxID=1032 RepID=UPI00262EC153|nr:dTDP-4-dehydrorhamnose 3,5-epimerase [Thiothrix sp.]MDD5392925.1 dTDP-4-dehydrorhamnose 3,5-epimerase [Thiothrix sp.]
MGTVSVAQIKVTPLKRISLAGGDVLHGMKRDEPGFVDFGEAYFSMIEVDAIKAWKRHLRMTLNFVVPIGMVRFVFMDDQGGLREEVTGMDRYVRLTVPPGIWFGFKGLTAPYSMLMNIADIPHDPVEIERKSLDEIHFNWEHMK